MLFLLRMVSEIIETRVVFWAVRPFRSVAVPYLVEFCFLLQIGVSNCNVSVGLTPSSCRTCSPIANRTETHKHCVGPPMFETVFWLIAGELLRFVFFGISKAVWVKSDISHPMCFLRSGSALVLCAVSVEKML